MVSSERFFDVGADGYDRLMGRYLPSLGPRFAEAAGVSEGQRALDVGCGPGGLTTVLVDRLGVEAVSAIDPSPPFVAACRARHPGLDVQEGVAERLPYPDDFFDVTLACLVVGFMADPLGGVSQMRRVTRPGGMVALCFWDLERMPLLGTFWGAVRSVRPEERGEIARTGRRRGELAELLERAGCTGMIEAELPATAEYASFADWWSSFTGGAGPVGAFQANLSPEERALVQARSRELLGDPAGPFTQEAWTWCAVGRA